MLTVAPPGRLSEGFHKAIPITTVMNTVMSVTTITSAIMIATAAAAMVIVYYECCSYDSFCSRDRRSFTMFRRVPRSGFRDMQSLVVGFPFVCLQTPNTSPENHTKTLGRSPGMFLK